jgi:hypothetical protein
MQAVNLGESFGKTAGYNKHNADGTTLGRLKTVVKELFYPMLPTLRQNIAFWKAPRISPVCPSGRSNV